LPALTPAGKPSTGPPSEEAISPKDARRGAWMSFAQALYGSAEFRYLK
jgi:hypothetical protein